MSTKAIQEEWALKEREQLVKRQKRRGEEVDILGGKDRQEKHERCHGEVTKSL